MCESEDGLKVCFLPGPVRACLPTCRAYVEEGKTVCRLLNVVEKLIPLPARPMPPKAPT